MKTLILLRHAKSGWDDRHARDFDRVLNAKGERAARTVGRRMAADGLAFDAIAASPAARVRGTIAEFEAGYGAIPAPRFDERLYLAPPDIILEVAGETPETVQTLMIVGHNPGLEDLVLALVPDGQGPRADVEEKFPTASVAVLSLTIDRWSDAARARATLERFVRPRDLDPALGPDRS